jgi:predicted component of type VI protein secretion system
LLTVTVFLPDGARFELARLVQEPPELNPDTTASSSQQEER